MFNIHQLATFAAAAQNSGQRVVLVTLYNVSGTSSRNPGAHLAVREDGHYVGSLSDGCIEGAIVKEALDVLAAGRPREMRLGKGSPYIDIRLPCGGSIDLLFNEMPIGICAAMLAEIEARRPFCLHLPRIDGQSELLAGSARAGVAVSDAAIEVQHVPPLRLAILGHGLTIVCLHDLARAIGIEVVSATPDERLAGELRARGADPILLKGLASVPPLTFDRWTACTLFFHDHDWEPALLGPILASDAFHVGAMGSRKTHDLRCERLADMGVSAERIAAIAAPIGLIPSLRDPETLAVSTLAQVIDAYNRHWGTTHGSP